MADAANNGAPTGANMTGGQATDSRSSTGVNTGLGLTNYDLQGNRRRPAPAAIPTTQQAPPNPIRGKR